MRLVPTILAVCLLPLVLAACGDSSVQKDPRNKPPLVRVAAVERASGAARSFTGVVVARTQSDLGFRVPGKVLERLVDTGETVRRGQLLMRLDPVDLQLQARAQQEAVASARARARQTADDEARYRGLIAAGAISASTYDQIKAAADSARAQLSAAQAQADVARNATGYAALLADADGVVMDTLAEPGQVVSAGQAVVRLARAGQREAIVHLPETLRPAQGSTAQAARYGSTSASVAARLRLLSEAADATTRTFEARYVLGGALANAPLGATITLDIAVATDAAQALQVPAAALYDPGNGPGVWVVAGEPTKVTWRPVRVVGVGGQAARVEGQLSAGEQVVALGVHLLHDNQKVHVAQVPVVAGSQP
ncbi:efflux RND transporter periplasmic adaptor subunit [Pseudomonas sp. URIL14HWK12:I9]|uniref:efflux RND transporter periplasmic adaptor subunit n=1 Tax=unclassified Pseudomonas TaxID=196821 RepID=UPI000BCE4DE7|nr:RND family efflux transporter MFP subunit [Pseudomonas sp. URIL14HWK12:I12]PVZ27535.1 RND family efflux transporter MFP subunit [Pseudomonas sp. URIL14HWK12:I10]PVZ38424.1 RND family efflux transporter MFP subunit [Pseudomonas sp. URIL14HWK12:I11]SNZ03411.1 RND family efflux transporter, MFP subunit [Pseudomonas sp. URIL14HWK12:I9]